MSLAATILFKNAGSEFIAVWLQTTVFNFPMAFFWQIFFCGPLVRRLFRLLVPAAAAASACAEEGGAFSSAEPALPAGAALSACGARSVAALSSSNRSSIFIL